MRKRTPTVEWYIAQDDADWAAHNSGPRPDMLSGPAGATPGCLDAKRFLGGVAVLLLLLVSASYWWWRTAQAGSQQATREVRTTAHKQLEPATQSDDAAAASLPAHQTATDWWLQHGEEVSDLRATVKADKPGAQFDLNVRVLALQDDQAVVSVSAAAIAGMPKYQQTRFYRRTAAGWRRTDPDVTLWGPERRLETPSFVFHFRQHDAPAVIAVAPRVDALYTTLRRNFSLPLTSGAEKLVIEVSVTQSPGQTAPWDGAPEPLLVPSPALYLAPVELSDADLLEQSIALPLLAQVLAQVSEHYTIDSAWQPMLEGLRLWQVWDLDLPLSAWRAEVVHWLYVDLPTADSGQVVVLPEHYTALCTMHKLWLPSPMQINIPLMCADQDWEEMNFARWDPHDPLTRLDQLTVPVRPDEYATHTSDWQQLRLPDYVVAQATLIEYTVATYGRERLPVLLAGLGHYDSWETLIPAVYGVSAAEFEAGWQAYLKAHYGG